MNSRSNGIFSIMANLKILYTNADQLSNKMDLLKLRIAAELPLMLSV